MADVMPIQTYEYKLNDIDIVNGQLIVCMDTGSMYRDSADKRIKLGSELELVDSLPDDPKTNKFYFVDGTNELWLYDGEWIEINRNLVVQKNSSGGVELFLGKQNSDSGIKFKGKGATLVSMDSDGTVSISTDPDNSISVISNLEIDKLLSM